MSLGDQFRAVVMCSIAAALLGSSVFIVNPNVLYLQATPMTEPLLIALTLVAVAFSPAHWLRSQA